MRRGAATRDGAQRPGRAAGRLQRRRGARTAPNVPRRQQALRRRHTQLGGRHLRVQRRRLAAGVPRQDEPAAGRGGGGRRGRRGCGGDDPADGRGKGRWGCGVGSGAGGRG